MKSKRIMRTIFLSVLISFFAVNTGLCLTAKDLAREAIDKYDKSGDVNRLKWALDTLIVEIQRPIRPDTKIDPDPDLRYYAAEAEVKLLTDSLKNCKHDSSLSSQIRLKILELWSYTTTFEEESPDTNISSGDLLRNIFERAISTIITSARYLDHPNSLAPLVKGIIERAEKHDLMFIRGTSHAFSSLAIIKEFLYVDYPNMDFLSNIWIANELDARLRPVVIESEADLFGDTVSLLGQEAASLALAAVRASRTDQGKCLAYCLAARNTRRETPESALVYYNRAIAEFDNFQDPAEGYLREKFQKPNIISDFIWFIRDLYGTRLWEQGNFLQYANILESAWRIEGLNVEQRKSLAFRLVNAYAPLIRQAIEQGKNTIAEDYIRKQQEKRVYLNLHPLTKKE
jgi:hypothetical protein